MLNKNSSIEIFTNTDKSDFYSMDNQNERGRNRLDINSSKDV